ncbi:MAG: helix-turn-helix domain-containing protein [Actinoplanes sp.]
MIGADEWPAALAISGMPPLQPGRVKDDGFQGDLTVAGLGPVRLAEFVTPGGVCLRDADMVRAADQELWQIDVITDGRVLAEQDGRRAELGPTDLVLIDPARPVRFTTTATTSITMLFPRHLLRLRTDDVAQMSAVRIAGDRGPGALVSALARGLARTTDGLRVQDAARLGTAVADLVAAALSAELGRTYPSAGDLLRSRILSFVEGRLADRDLGPAMIAAAHHISVRWLHKLFENEPVTVSELIRQRRLHKARGDLGNPDRGGRSIAATAARWGFADAGHFSRAFKDAYGQTAADYRRGEQAGRAG